MQPAHPNIVIATPDSNQRVTLAKYLRNGVYKVSKAGEWHACLRRLKKHPDLLLLDLSMERAWRILERVKRRRQNGKGNGIAVLTFDPYRNTLRELKAFHLGADGYVGKPLIKEELLSVVGPLIEQKFLKAAQAQILSEEEKKKKTLESEVKRLNDFSEKIASNIPLSIIILDAQKNITYVNQYFCRAMGKSSEELLGLSLEQIFPETLYGPIELIEKVESVLQSGHPTPRFSMMYRGDDFMYRVLPVSLGRKKVAEGPRRHAMILIENVAELKSLGEKVKLSEERYRTLFEHSPDGNLIVRAGGGRILEANPRAAKLLGEGKQKLKRKALITFFPTNLRETVRKSLNRQDKNPFDLPDLSLRLPKGKTRILGATTSPIFHKGENALFCIFRDVTERRYLEEQVRQSEKTSLLGQFTAGAAHEINNPLAIISSNVQYLLSKMDEGKIGRRDFEEINETLKLIDSESRYCGEIIKNLLAYTHRGSQAAEKSGEVDKKRIDISEVLENSLRILAHQLKLSNIRIKTRIETPLALILGHANLLEHVFMNLIWNAQVAMPKGGALKIEARNIPKSGAIEIFIKDSGVGISQKNLQKLFTPFFTTKEVGKGTGLGLWVVRSIVEEHQGTISVKSRVNKGSTFILRFPMVAVPPVI